jgi:hypothetical protein
MIKNVEKFQKFAKKNCRKLPPLTSIEQQNKITVFHKMRQVKSFPLMYHMLSETLVCANYGTKCDFSEKGGPYQKK